MASSISPPERIIVDGSLISAMYSPCDCRTRRSRCDLIQLRASEKPSSDLALPD